MKNFNISIVADEVSTKEPFVLSDGVIWNRARVVLNLRTQLDTLVKDIPPHINLLTVVAFYSGKFEGNEHLEAMEWGKDFWKIEEAYVLGSLGEKIDVSHRLTGEIEFKLWEAHSAFCDLNKIHV